MEPLIIALTGGTGFVGSNLLTKILKAGHTVVALHRRGEITNLMRHERLSWNSLDSMEAYLSTRKFNMLIHLSTAYGQYQKLSEMVAVNVGLPLRLLESAVQGGCRMFINTDTFYAKPDFDYPHMRPYIQTKVELMRWLSLSAENTPELKVVNARLEHVYGSGDGSQKFVPFVVRKLKTGEELNLTLGEQLRDFIHVQDVIEAYLTIINHYNQFKNGVTEIEVGTGTAVSIKSFVETAWELSYSHSKLNFGALPYRNREIMHSVADTSALVAMGWLPRVTLRDGIQETLKTNLH